MAVTYAELKTAVEDTVENTFSATDFATMTRLAEQKIYQSVQLPILRKDATLTLTNGIRNVDLPLDFLAAYSVAVYSSLLGNNGARDFLLNKDVNFIRESYPVPSAVGTPKYYALDGTSTLPSVQKIILGPTPGANLALDINYFYQPESIVTSVLPTWLGQNFESVLINAVLVEAARFMKSEQDIVQLYTTQFNDSLLLLKNLGDGKNRMDAYRSGQVRDAVK